MPYQNIYWGVIGTGAVCEVKSVPAMLSMPNSTVIGVTNRNLDKASDFATRFAIGKVYDDAETILLDKDINAVYIATPPSSHLHYTILAAQSHKAIYVEKPMALNYDQCEEMILTCAYFQVPLYVAYYRRAYPLYRDLKKMVLQDIGMVLSVEIRLVKAADPALDLDHMNWRVIPEISGGGYFVDLASHQLDLMDFIFGPLTVVQGCASNHGGFYQAEDVVSAELITEQQVPVRGYWDFHSTSSRPEDRIVIVGTKGKITVSTFGKWEILLERTGLPPQLMEYSEIKNVQYYLIQEIMDDLRGIGVASSTGTSAARTSRIMDVILQNYYEE